MWSGDLSNLPRPWAHHPFVLGDQWRWHEARALAAEDYLVVSMAARAGHAPGRARSLTALGDPVRVAQVLADHHAELLAGALPQSASMPPGAWHQLPAVLREQWDLPRHGRWDWMWTRTAPPAHHLEDRVVRLDTAAHERQIRDLQAVALPGTHFNPDRPGATWFGIWRTDDGRPADPGLAADAERITGLAAVAGSYDWVHAVHLGGIGTHPDLRGAGLGGALTAAITRAAVARFGQVSLGVYADNHRAKALYARLGYSLEHEVDSRHAAT